MAVSLNGLTREKQFYNMNNIETNDIHGYNRTWSKWITNKEI